MRQRQRKEKRHHGCNGCQLSCIETKKPWESKVTMDCDVLPDDMILFGRFDLVLKDHGASAEKAKVRFVAQGYNDCDNI